MMLPSPGHFTLNVEAARSSETYLTTIPHGVTTLKTNLN